MIRAYDDYGNVVNLVEWKKKIRADAIDEFVSNCKEWNKTSSKRIPYKAIEEISKQLKEHK